MIQYQISKTALKFDIHFVIRDSKREVDSKNLIKSEFSNFPNFQIKIKDLELLIEKILLSQMIYPILHL